MVWRFLEIRPALLKFRDDQGDEIDFTAPYATATIRRTHALAVDEFIFLRAVTAVTPKITLPAPSTTHFLRFSDFADRAAYGDIDRFFADLVGVFRQEIAELVAAGCRTCRSTRSLVRCCAIPRSATGLRSRAAFPMR
jgi:methionine synthase II (cobalamin-independent)